MYMNSVNREKSLPDERYDEKLFKQAYKAGLEAKELEEKNNHRRKLLHSVLVLLSILCLVSIFCVFIIFKKEKPEYIESGSINKVNALYNIQDNFDLSPTNTSISVDNISAESAISLNPKNGTILFQKNIDEKRPIASLTKLLSIMVALDSMNPEDTIIVDLSHIPEDLDWKLELKEGDRIKIDYLIKSMLLSSFNDSAYILANAYPQGYDSFIKEMNKKAKSLRMNDSKFDNPAGLDSENNYSTARDVGKLVSAVLNYEYILNIVNKGSAQISWDSNNELISKTVYSTNELYGENKYIKGLKTGITDMAKQCFVGYFVYNNKNELITIVIGSDDRFKDTEKLEYLSRKILE